MNGRVDDYGRALIEITLSARGDDHFHQFEVWIDTGFNGELVLPQRKIDQFALPHSGSVKATLADGTEHAMKTYSCILDWFGETHSLEVVANEGTYPLLALYLASAFLSDSISTSAIDQVRLRSTSTVRNV